MTSALILLVGNNPLPNYVSCRALWENPVRGPFDRLVLVFSAPDKAGDADGTQDVMVRLKGEIGISPGVLPASVVEVPLKDPADGAEIENAVRKSVEDCEKVHLNYTGGTKEMAVHAYSAVAGLSCEVDFSYLDSRIFKLRFPRGRTSERDLRKVVTLDFETLFRMHGTPIYEPGTDEPYLPKTASVLAQAMSRMDPTTVGQVGEAGKPRRPEPIAKTMGKWTGQFRVNDSRRLSGETYADFQIRQYKEWRKGHSHVEFPAWTDSQTGFPELREIFQEETGLDCATGIRFQQLSFEHGNRIREFFHGKWLESAVLDAITQAMESPARMNVKIRRKAAREAEVDVIALRGYQVFLFSCIAATGEGARNRQKQHAFEAAHRALQLGGEEARAILVTTEDADRARDLQNDLKTDLGGALTVKVLDRNDLTRLQSVTQEILGGV